MIILMGMIVTRVIQRIRVSKSSFGRQPLTRSFTGSLSKSTGRSALENRLFGFKRKPQEQMQHAHLCLYTCNAPTHTEISKIHV